MDNPPSGSKQTRQSSDLPDGRPASGNAVQADGSGQAGDTGLTRAGAAQAPVFSPLTDQDVPELEFIELLFFAYRDFTGDPDRLLSSMDFGRAHHRVLYFVNRRPGMPVAELLDILKITKQSLARVLKQLLESGHIVQKTGSTDRRKRLLYPTQRGRELVVRLSRPQSRRIHAAIGQTGQENEAAIRQFLAAMSKPG
ncbi:MAG: MarR family transcriptional regulator [Nitratireductor sp.]|nr:MarR family transcriptional regulator [Nitratireductor sp.]MCC0022157.1 MarR family transcriptional regulator [Nitratireductor sp.]